MSQIQLRKGAHLVVKQVSKTKKTVFVFVEIQTEIGF